MLIDEMAGRFVNEYKLRLFRTPLLIFIFETTGLPDRFKMAISKGGDDR